MKRSIFVTGSTDGIGKLTAIKLANEGHKIFVHGRNTEKLSKTIAEIKEMTGNQDIQGYIADFSDLDSVKAMAIKMNSEVEKLDVLINNAGVFNSRTIKNKDGLDMRMVVNYLAQYLVTDELMPLLDKGTEPRIINLSSAAQAPVSYPVLLGEAQSDMGDTYAQSKLALTMWSFHLAKKLPEFVVIPVNPGSLQNTRMVREAYGTSWSSPDKGASILSELALSPSYVDYSGKYFDNDSGKFANAHPVAYSQPEIIKLIDTTDELIMKLVK